MGKPRIHLLMTCLVTNTRRDGTLSTEDRYEYLLRSLRSLEKLEIEKASLFLEFGEDVDFNIEILQGIVGRISKQCELNFFRLDRFEQWSLQVNRLATSGADLVLLLTYEDHEFVGGSTEEFDSIADLILNTSEQKFDHQVFSILSHFPEAHIQCDYWGLLGFNERIGGRDVVPAVTPIGCLLALPATLQSWFATDFSQGAKLVSTENYFGPSVSDGRNISIVPNEELFRHIDGYGHVALHDHPGLYSNYDKSPGLISRSRTWRSLVRTSGPMTFMEFLDSIHWHSLGSKASLITRSLLFEVPHSFGLKGSLNKFHYKLMRNFPEFYRLASTAFAHGPARFSVIFFRDLLRRFRRST